MLLSLAFNLFNTNGEEHKFIVSNAERILLNKEESKNQIDKVLSVKSYLGGFQNNVSAS